MLLVAAFAGSASARTYTSPNASAAFGSTSNNDDSCDIGTAPAATLLLPYFEVETATRGIDTMFTVVNVGHAATVAHVTLWSDWSFPVLTFSVPLSGYEVQSISLFDVLVRGVMPGGTCNLPAVLPTSTLIAMRGALTGGTYEACGTKRVGAPAATHRTATTAVGYATIDVTAACSSTLPSDPAYFANEILFDNVLTGDYQTIDRAAGINYAGGNPLVHIRAIPEGGPAGTPLTGHQTNLPYTFYSGFVSGNFDRRQPLPATFAARWAQGGAGHFNADLKIWREGIAGPTTCANAVLNSAPTIFELVRFDSHENPNTLASGCITSGGSCYVPVTLPSTSRVPTASGTFPLLNSPADDTTGWMYLNLNNTGWGTTPFSSPPNLKLHPQFSLPRPSQNWVVVSMSGTGNDVGLFGVEFDATWLGNGCTPSVGTSTANGGMTRIGPVGGILVCPPTHTKCVPGKGLYTGSNVLP
jgi:hypothetical protein